MSDEHTTCDAAKDGFGILICGIAYGAVVGGLLVWCLTLVYH